MRRARILALFGLACCGRLDFQTLAPSNGAPDGRSIDADLTGLTCTIHTALTVPLASTVTNTVTAMSTTSGSCGGTATSEDVYALDLPVAGGLLVAADYPTESSSPIVYIRTDCDDAQSELACDDTNGVGSSPEIHLESLPAARYFVFVDGKVTGTYNATIQTLLPLGATCDPANTRDRCDANLMCNNSECAPATCTIAQAFSGAGPFTVTGDTSGATNLHGGSCGQGQDGGLRGPELVYTVAVATPLSDLVVSTSDPVTNFDTLVYVTSSCDGPEIACDDDSGGGAFNTSLAHTGPISAGTYFVFIDGFGYSAGTAKVTITLTP